MVLCCLCEILGKLGERVEAQSVTSEFSVGPFRYHVGEGMISQ